MDRSNLTLRNRPAAVIDAKDRGERDSSEKITSALLNDDYSRKCIHPSPSRWNTHRAALFRLWRSCNPLVRLSLVLYVISVSFLIMVGILDVFLYSNGIPESELSPSPNSKASSFAVVINTYKRPDRLRDAVSHYAETCGTKHKVGQVYIVWAELGNAPPPTDSFFSHGPPSPAFRGSADKEHGSTPAVSAPASSRSGVTIIEVEKDSLNSRFLPIKGLGTPAVFMVDDDVRVDCDSLSRGFDAWRYSPNAMVGYYPRLSSTPLSLAIWRARNINLSQTLQIYHTWPVVFLTGKFNIILTKACFLLSKYLSPYSGEDHPNEIRDYVDKHKNCEDVAMSFLVANATKYEQSTSGPIYVEGSVKDTGLFGGISTGSGHMTTRSDCLTELASIYTKHGWGLPLYDVDLTKQGWRKHYPGFWWQNRPSNVFEWPSFGNMLS